MAPVETVPRVVDRPNEKIEAFQSGTFPRFGELIWSYSLVNLQDADDLPDATCSIFAP
jgi:hypothetical protein